MSKEVTTETKILQAARKVFHQKGLAGARMQEIADEAGINKAMLHYYYRSKDALFEAVFNEDFIKLAPAIFSLFTTPMPLLEKINQFCEKYISTMQENPHLPIFIFNELAQNPDRLIKFLVGQGRIDASFLKNQIEEETKAKNIREIEPEQLIVNMVAMCIFPFVAKPMVKAVMGFNDEEFDRFITSRKKEVPFFIHQSLKI